MLTLFHTLADPFIGKYKDWFVRHPSQVTEAAKREAKKRTELKSPSENEPPQRDKPQDNQQEKPSLQGEDPAFYKRLYPVKSQTIDAMRRYFLSTGFTQILIAFDEFLIKNGYSYEEAEPHEILLSEEALKEYIKTSIHPKLQHYPETLKQLNRITSFLFNEAEEVSEVPTFTPLRESEHLRERKGKEKEIEASSAELSADSSLDSLPEADEAGARAAAGAVEAERTRHQKLK